VKRRKMIMLLRTGMIEAVSALIWCRRDLLNLKSFTTRNTRMNRIKLTPGKSWDAKLANDTTTMRASNQFQPDRMKSVIHDPNMLKASSTANAMANTSSIRLKYWYIGESIAGWISASARDVAKDAMITVAKNVSEIVES